MSDPIKMLEAAHEDGDKAVNLWPDEIEALMRQINYLTKKVIILRARSVDIPLEVVSIMGRLKQAVANNQPAKVVSAEYIKILEAYDNLIMAALGV